MDNIVLDLFSQIFLVYAITLVITSSSILDPIRQWIIQRTIFLYSPLSRLFPNYQINYEEKHFIECRLCLGVWITLLVCLFYNSLEYYGLIFGASYFLCTQER